MASRPAGRALNLIGHGVRPLLIYGLIELESTPAVTKITARRYLCVPCGAVCLVVPAEVAPRRYYSWPSIALALALWALRGVPAAGVRTKLCAFPIIGPSVIGWASLRRWARAYGVGEGTLRERAARFVQQVLATSPLSAQRHALEPRVFASSLSRP